jgi:hypothetical protein
MPGWDSLNTVATLSTISQVLALILVIVVAAGGSMALIYRPDNAWPERIEVQRLSFGIVPFKLPPLTLHRRWIEIGIAAVLALLILAEVAAFGFSYRKDTLASARDGALTALQSRLEQSQQLAAADTARHANELSEFQKKLAEAEGRAQRAATEAAQARTALAALQQASAQRRLSEQERHALVEALAPYGGQKVSVASILHDDDGKALAEDFVAVLDEARWDHDGEAGVSYQQWDRDPIGIEIWLNEKEARAGRVQAGIGALIAAVRHLGLMADNTLYMSRDVPAGEAQIRIGKKLRK